MRRENKIVLLCVVVNDNKPAIRFSIVIDETMELTVWRSDLEGLIRETCQSGFSFKEHIEQIGETTFNAKVKNNASATKDNMRSTGKRQVDYKGFLKELFILDHIYAAGGGV